MAPQLQAFDTVFVLGYRMAALSVARCNDPAAVTVSEIHRPAPPSTPTGPSAATTPNTRPSTPHTFTAA
ncbi:hypothetical protein OPT61_g1429 [Boeremia exigua]|uniref:Uncharacterized protein n=1 Tax=Boeremia exigua TaxID=749465 RepID=A0ACC2IQ70_9PLEO|nr:hypothetical protein OPT61_g1429 [Boeremia exigua]